jgi:hypothetical protein
VIAHASDQRTDLLGRRLRVVALLEQGEIRAAEVEAQQFERTAARLGRADYAWYPALWRAAIAAARGDEGERAHWREVLGTHAAGAGGSNAALMAVVHDAAMAMDTGDDAAGRVILAAVGAFDALSSDLQFDVTLARFGSPRESTARLLDRTLAAEPDSEWIPMLVQLAEIIGREGDAALAARLRPVLERYTDVWAIEGLGAAIRGPVHRFLTALDGVDGGVAGGNGFRLDGDSFLLTFQGTTVRLRHSKGLGDLHRLLAAPGRELSALDLAAPGGTVVDHGVGDTLDATARAAYRNRLVEIEAELDDADERADIGRSSALAEERDALLSQLAGAFGLGGRARPTGQSAERARTAVRARIRDALARIEAVHPALGRHLHRSVRTGSFCTYDPDPPTTWET